MVILLVIFVLVFSSVVYLVVAKRGYFLVHHGCCLELLDPHPPRFTTMGIVRKVLLGLKIRAGCIFSLLLNAFEWHLRFKI
jgi:hypothetical protein